MSALHYADDNSAEAGFTLAEMLVVLAILAILTLVAVSSLEPAADQARYESTVRTLTNLSEALLGKEGASQPDGTPIISGFVADIGRLPKVLSNDLNNDGIITDEEIGSELRELWSQDTSLASTFGFKSRPGPGVYNTVSLPCGWRGPYLNLGVGRIGLRDGLGLPFMYSPDSGAEVQIIESSLIPGSPDLDLSSNAYSPLVKVSGIINLKSSSMAALPTSAVVTLLGPGPDEADPNVLKVWSEANEAGSSHDLNSDLVFEFANVPIGLRAIHISIPGVSNPVVKYVLVARPGAIIPIAITIP